MTNTAGEQLKLDGIEAVLGNNANWAQVVADFFAVWIRGKPEGFEFIGEDLRRDVLAAGIPDPSHPNAWGGVLSRLVRSRQVQDTGMLRKTVGPDAHARRSAVWRVVR